MNAIVKISGKQYSVEKDTKLFVDKLQEKEGAKVKFDDVLMVDNGKDTKIGNPLVVGASVEAWVDPKVVVRPWAELHICWKLIVDSNVEGHFNGNPCGDNGLQNRLKTTNNQNR